MFPLHKRWLFSFIFFLTCMCHEAVAGFLLFASLPQMRQEISIDSREINEESDEAMNILSIGQDFPLWDACRHVWWIAREAVGSGTQWPSVKTQIQIRFGDLVQKSLEILPLPPRITSQSWQEIVLKVRHDLLLFYKERGYAPIWLNEKGEWGRAAASVFIRLRLAEEDGLSLDLKNFEQLSEGEDRLKAEAEVRLSFEILLYAYQASRGRIRPTQISKWIQDGNGPFSVSNVLLSISVADQQAGERLQAYNPPQSGYNALRAKLADVKHTPLAADIVANMEMWRWMPRDLGRDRIEVNLPDFELKVIRDQKVVHQARVIVGKPTTPTPIFSNMMQRVIINPSWHVPQSIIRKEMLPKYAENPHYFSNLGYEVIQKNGHMEVRQPPGERNALGHVKFLFPNEYSVYLHDTPQRALFAQAKRTFSHGCVRVDQPLALAEVILGKENGWSQERVQKMIGKAEQSVRLTTPLPVHLQYFTLFLDEQGGLQRREDIYSYIQKIKTALGWDVKIGTARKKTGPETSL